VLQLCRVFEVPPAGAEALGAVMCGGGGGGGGGSGGTTVGQWLGHPVTLPCLTVAKSHKRKAQLRRQQLPAKSKTSKAKARELSAQIVDWVKLTPEQQQVVNNRGMGTRYRARASTGTGMGEIILERYENTGPSLHKRFVISIRPHQRKWEEEMKCKIWYFYYLRSRFVCFLARSQARFSGDEVMSATLRYVHYWK
jgi:hypothetical protein